MHAPSTVAPESFASEARLPSRRIGTSEGLGWRSVLVRGYEDPDETDGFTTAATPDMLVVLNAAGTFTMESRRARGGARARYRPGSVGVTAPLVSATLAWRREPTEQRRSVHIFLSAKLLQETATALGRPNLVHGLPDALLLDDPVVATTSAALWAALRNGAQPLEADALAQSLALHLVYGRLLAGAPTVIGAGSLTAATLERVLEYMAAHAAEPIGLDELAAVAALSKFHFLRLFKEATGVTPHRYLTRLRLERAAQALRGTNDPVAAVALASGYASPGQFARAFRRQFGVAPSAFRRATLH
jgi:AraC family transcriptional regulator